MNHDMVVTLIFATRWWSWSYLCHEKSSDNCGWAGAAVVAVNQHRALALTLSFGFTTESDLGCDGWLKWSRVWCFVWKNPGQHLGDEGKDGRQVWKQVLSREVSHLIIIINTWRKEKKESRLTNMLLHDPIDGNWWWSDSMIQPESGHFSFLIVPGTMFPNVLHPVPGRLVSHCSRPWAQCFQPAFYF